MKRWRDTVDDAAFSGGIASALSTLVLAWRGGNDAPGAAAAVNAPSHWFWRRALCQDGASLKYTFVGMVVHHMASVFWACIYERMDAAVERGTQGALRDAAVVAAVAAWVDLEVVPSRLTPGFERRLRPGSLCLVYAAFAGGLALASVLRARARDRFPQQPDEGAIE